MYSTIFSVHVRRTDRIPKWGKHKVDEYMLYVEAYFRRLEDRGRSVTRKIYLATDEVKVITELKKK